MCISFSLSTFLSSLFTWLCCVLSSRNHHYHHRRRHHHLSLLHCLFHSISWISSKNLEFNIRRTLNFLFPPDIVLFLMVLLLLCSSCCCCRLKPSVKDCEAKRNSRKMNKMSAVIEDFLLYSPVRESFHLKQGWQHEALGDEENVFYRKLQFYLFLELIVCLLFPAFLYTLLPFTFSFFFIVPFCPTVYSTTQSGNHTQTYTRIVTLTAQATRK